MPSTANSPKQSRDDFASRRAANCRPPGPARRILRHRWSMARMLLTCMLAIVGTAVLLAQQKRAEVPPFKLPAGVTIDHDLVYARYGSRELKLDLYRPESGAGPFPGIVFIHGGGWRAGTRTQFRRQAAYLATKGFVSVSIDYRFSEEAAYPAALYDSKAAVRWIRANAARYKVNPDKIAASGGSAGGHLAALLGTTGDVRTLEGNGGNPGFSSRVQAVVAFNGVYDFVSLSQEALKRQQIENVVFPFLGGSINKVPEVWVQASPVAHVSRNSPPFLILHGTGDTTVPYQQALEMQRDLRSVGVRAELYSAKGANHGFFNRPPFYEPTLQRMERFLRSVFGN
jgi:acetyl esterase/lipase